MVVTSLQLRLGIAGTPTTPTTFETSITHGGAEYFFSSSSSSLVPATVQVGRYVDGQPFAIITANRWVFKVTPESMTALGAVGNGLMVNPWLWGATPLTPVTQGFDQLLTSAFIDGSEASGWDAAKNLDPTAAGAIALDSEKSLVKSIRKSGLTLPLDDSDYPLFADWCVLHIVSVVPPFGAFAPGASDLDKTSYYTTGIRNKGALGGGFAYSSGMPTLATCEADGYFSRSFWSFFGQTTGELMQPMIVGNYQNLVYSGQYARYWNDFVAALLAEGSDVDDDALNRALAFGVTLIGLVNRDGSGWGSSGAGQWCGYKQFAQLFAHVFHGSDATLVDKALSIEGNVNGQQFWVTSDLVGEDQKWPDVHGGYHAAFYPVHVGMPWWGASVTRAVDFSALPNTDYDSQIGADYEFVTSPANFGEMMNILLLKDGPEGLDGGQVMLQGGAMDATNPYAACIAYNDRLAGFTSNGLFYGNVPTIKEARDINYYADRRADSAVARWTGIPDTFDFLNGYTSLTPYLSAVSGGFTWDFSSLATVNTTETIVEHQVQYSLDAQSWVDVAVQGASGTQTDLTRTLTYVRVRRRSVSGWGPWSWNYVRATGDGLRWVATPTGVPSNATAAFTVVPHMFIREYPAWKGPSWVVADGDTITFIEQDSGFFVGTGYVTGYPVPTIEWQKERDAVPVGAPSSSSFFAPDAEDVDTDISFDVTATNTGGSDSDTTAAVTVPPLPAAAYTVVTFGGSAYMARTLPLNLSDGKQGTFGITFAPGVDGSFMGLFAAGNSGSGTRFYMQRRVTGNVLRWSAKNSAGTIIGTKDFGTFNIAGGEKTVLISWDMATNTFHCYVNGVDVGTDPTLTDAAVDYDASPGLGVANNNQAGDVFTGSVKMLYFDTTYVDLSVSGNRDKFLLANIQDNGSGVTGAIPTVFMCGSTTLWNEGLNRGYGGQFTMIGSVT